MEPLEIKLSKKLGDYVLSTPDGIPLKPKDIKKIFKKQDKALQIFYPEDTPLDEARNYFTKLVGKSGRVARAGSWASGIIASISPVAMTWGLYEFARRKVCTGYTEVERCVHTYFNNGEASCLEWRTYLECDGYAYEPFSETIKDYSDRFALSVALGVLGVAYIVSKVRKHRANKKLLRSIEQDEIDTFYGHEFGVEWIQEGSKKRKSRGKKKSRSKNLEALVTEEQITHEDTDEFEEEEEEEEEEDEEYIPSQTLDDWVGPEEPEEVDSQKPEQEDEEIYNTESPKVEDSAEKYLDEQEPIKEYDLRARLEQAGLPETLIDYGLKLNVPFEDGDDEEIYKEKLKIEVAMRKIATRKRGN